MTDDTSVDPMALIGIFFYCLLAVGALVVYLLPSVIAFIRKHHYVWIILALNVFGGLIGGVGWIIALIWAIWPRKTGLADVILNDPTTNSSAANREIYSRYGENLRAFEDSAARDRTGDNQLTRFPERPN